MDFKNINWIEGKEPLLSYLYSLADKKYCEFSKKITPGEFTMIGVRIPVLKKLAREIASGDYESFLKIEDERIYELRMLKGLVISNIKDIEKFKKYFLKFVPLIDNWAVCDIFLASSKIIKKDKEFFFELATSYLKEKDEFLNRVSFVIFLDYFVIDEYVYKVLECIRGYESDAYYANMALSWLLSIIYIKYPQLTKEYLLKEKFSYDVIKYTIRKIKDSYRVSAEDKEWLKKISL